MSDTPKKKAPAKKQAQKKTAPSKGTGKPGRPKKVQPANIEAKPKPEVDASPKEEQTPETNQVVIHANDVKKPSLRKRMLSWFK